MSYKNTQFFLDYISQNGMCQNQTVQKKSIKEHSWAQKEILEQKEFLEQKNAKSYFFFFHFAKAFFFQSCNFNLIFC